MSVVTEEVLRTIAAMLDHPSVYMGGPSQRNMRRAEQILAAVAPLIAAQEREAAIAAAAKALDAYRKWDGEITPERLMKPITAAIRALPQ